MTSILNYKIFSSSKNVLIDLIKTSSKINIISGNPEVLNAGLNNNELFNCFNSEEAVIIPDGIGTIISAKLLRCPVKEKIAGIEVMEEIIKYSCEKSLPIYLLGTKQDILEECVSKLKEKYNGINVCGYHNGFFDLENCEDVIKDINNKKPYAVFVAMGCPRQELFIAKYMDILNCNVFMGVGGSFDIFAGRLKRAPKWMIKIGLEWLYRVIKEPFRIKRLYVIPKFILKALSYNHNKEKE